MRKWLWDGDCDCCTTISVTSSCVTKRVMSVRFPVSVYAFSQLWERPRRNNRAKVVRQNWSFFGLFRPIRLNSGSLDSGIKGWALWIFEKVKNFSGRIKQFRSNKIWKIWFPIKLYMTSVVETRSWKITQPVQSPLTHRREKKSQKRRLLEISSIKMYSL